MQERFHDAGLVCEKSVFAELIVKSPQNQLPGDTKFYNPKFI